MDVAQLSRKRKRKHTKSASVGKKDAKAELTVVTKKENKKAPKKRKTEAEGKRKHNEEEASKVEAVEVGEEVEEKEAESENQAQTNNKAEDGNTAEPLDSEFDDDADGREGRDDHGAHVHPDRVLAMSIEDGSTIEDGNLPKLDSNGLPDNTQLHLPMTGEVPKHFSELNLHANTLKAIDAMGYKTMTEVQARTIPPCMAGRDVLGAAKTGSGKTLAFLIPAVEMLSSLRFKPMNGTGVLVSSGILDVG
jgi:ATP-dependent RNA helicase DDX18/HAS1